MSRLTTDRNDPGLKSGVDDGPAPQNEAYLVLSEEERKSGFVRPVRKSYRHVGPSGPRFALKRLTAEEMEQHKAICSATPYVAFEKYPEGESPVTGRFWTQAQLDHSGKGCGVVTTMSQEISETYARDPSFYGSTYCIGCSRHLPVEEFVWEGTDARVGS